MCRLFKFTQTHIRWQRYAWSILAFVIIGCTRSAPPDIPDFTPPPKPVVTEEVKPVLAVESTESDIEESAPEPKPETEIPVAKEPEPEAPPPPPKPAEPEPAAPSIVGSWRVTEMSHNGQSSPDFDQMEMTFTFSEDGTFSMSVSGEMLPEAHTQEGTYTIADGQITITAEGRSQSGTYSFDGNDSVTIEIDSARMVLTRT